MVVYWAFAGSCGVYIGRDWVLLIWHVRRGHETNVDEMSRYITRKREGESAVDCQGNLKMGKVCKCPPVYALLL